MTPRRRRNILLRLFRRKNGFLTLPATTVAPSRRQKRERTEKYVPNTKSAIKRLRQSERRRVQNKTVRSRLRTAVKRVRAAAKPDQATEHYREAVRLLDRAAARGIIHRNAAARTKSRLASHVRRLGGTV